ncbi:MAG: hypothetical protein JNK67_04210 [Alphaproteobacteria bacterium]|nr:hypothetical protein [Alphaproteobacteria bacterium]
MQIELAPVAASELVDPPPAEASARVAARVAAARARALVRAEELGPAFLPATNSELDGRALEQAAAMDPGARKLLSDVTARRRFSARSHSRVLRVARSIADLAGRAAIARADIAEALSYRRWPAGG